MPEDQGTKWESWIKLGPRLILTLILGVAKDKFLPRCAAVVPCSVCVCETERASEREHMYY